MTRIRLLPALALIGLAACGGDTAKRDDTAATPIAVQQNDAQRAAAIANAITAAPARTDSVLAAYGITADQLEQLMYKVARDSALSAEYGRLTAR